jgi:heme-binding NEAT domain protein
MLIYVIDASEYADERLVGFAISFSGQGSKAPIDYVVNEVYWAHNFGWEERA